MKKYVLAVLVVVLLAGCTQFQTGGQQEKPPEIQVEGPKCTVGGVPCGSTEVTKFGGPAVVRMTVGNFGEEDVTVEVGENGRQVLVSKCNNDLASLDSEDGGFSARIEGSTRSPDVTGDEAPMLGEDERLILEWRFDIVPEDGQVSRLGYSCPLEFEAGFSQDLETRRQVQIKSDTDVPDVSSLDETTTSQRPVRLRIDAPESFSTSQGALIVRAFLENTGRGEVEEVNYIDPVSSSFVDEYKREDCTPTESEQLRMFGEGPREGQSYRKTCVVEYDMDDDTESEIQWLEFSADYSYTLPLGTRTIRIQPTEGG